MKTHTTEIKREIRTALGNVRCGLIFDRRHSVIETKEYVNGSSEIFETEGHKIEFVSFKRRVQFYNDNDLGESFG